jgi:hypothetical protein
MPITERARQRLISNTMKYQIHHLPSDQHHRVLKSKSTLETAQHIVNHESPRTSKLYDQREDESSLDEVEWIAI